MLGVTPEFRAFLYNNQIRNLLIRAYFENTGVDSTRGLKSFDVELTDFITSFGSITRELNIEHGVFRAGTNTLVLKNSKDLGDYLFSLRKRFGDQLWNDKTYHIKFGFRQFPTATAITESLPKIATLGYGSPANQAQPTSSPITLGLGDTPAGETTLESATEETVKIYTGDTQEVVYDRVNDEIKISSKDYYQRLVEFKICQKFLASNIFGTASTVTDSREIQSMIKYGTHKLISRAYGDNSSLSNRSNPFSATLCIPNAYSSYAIGGAVQHPGSYAAYHLWYQPIKNALNVSGFNSGTLKLYYWDYIARIWKAFPVSYFTNSYIDFGASASAGYRGIYFWILDPTNCVIDTDTWTEYVNGNGGYYSSSTPDVAICAESVTSLADSNPIRIVHDLLTSARFMAINATLTDLLDYHDFTNNEYTFDAAYIFYDNEGVDINVDFDREISVSAVIQQICDLVGCAFYVSADKSSSTRRNLKIKLDKAWNPCANAPPSLSHFSTRDRLKSYETILSKDEFFDKITAQAFNSSYSTADNFDNIVTGTGNKVLALGNKNTYYYDCTVAAQGIIDRLYLKHSKPTEIIEIESDSSAMLVELADFVKIHDHKLDEDIVGEIFKVMFNLDNKVRLSARRYTKLYGPDETRPYKVYAFCGCAHAGTNKIGGSGADASITSGDKTVTFGTAVDTNLIKVGMAIRISSTMFWIASITDTTHLEVDTAAAATLTSQSWSIGNSYHAR